MSPLDKRPSDAYTEGVASGRWQADPAQKEALASLDRIHDELITARPAGLLDRLFGRGAMPARGLYLWGSVGRGKTFLIDLCYEQLPISGKRRVHFHRFMGEVHARLAELGDVSDPLERIAGEWARDLRLLCLDEFFVTDIGDAMILSRLLQALFKRDVCLLTTSNIEPDGLYRDGLQRARFLPAIELLKKRCEVILLTAHGTIKDGVQAIKNGAFDYISKGDDNNKIIPLLSRAVEKALLQFKVCELEQMVSNRHSFANIVGESKPMQKAIDMARKVASTAKTRTWPTRRTRRGTIRQPAVNAIA